MNIPFLDLRAQYRSIREEIDRKVLEIVSSQNFVLGPEVEALEREVAENSRTRFAVGVSSGSDALIISMMALGIGEEDEVVTTPFTFFATAGSVVRVKAKPVFCDIEERSFNIDPERLAELLKARYRKKGRRSVKAIIPVHLFGQCADMDPILALAREYDLSVIEDAAQAIGAEYPSSGGIKPACSMGDLGTLSFFPSKNLGGFGDGGMVLTNDEALEEKLKMLRVHGSRNAYYYELLGGNFRLDALQAAVLRIKLKHLEGWQEKRRERAALYDVLFRESGLIDEELVQVPEALWRESGARNFHTYHQYVIKAKDRDKLKTFLEEKSIGTAVYYPLPLHLQKCFAYLGCREGDCPVAEKAAREVLALPIYPELNSEQQDVIVSSIRDFYLLRS